MTKFNRIKETIYLKDLEEFERKNSLTLPEVYKQHF